MIYLYMRADTATDLISIRVYTLPQLLFITTAHILKEAHGKFIPEFLHTLQQLGLVVDRFLACSASFPSNPRPSLSN
jgi:hypothetical protein